MPLITFMDEANPQAEPHSRRTLPKSPYSIASGSPNNHPGQVEYRTLTQGRLATPFYRMLRTSYRERKLLVSLGLAWCVYDCLMICLDSFIPLRYPVGLEICCAPTRRYWCRL